MTYRFRALPELYWGVTIAMSLVLLQALLTLQPEQINDWQTWVVALGGAAIRAGAGAAFDWIRRSMTDRDAEVDDVIGRVAAMTPEQREKLIAETATMGASPNG